MKIKLQNILFSIITISFVNCYAQKGSINRATQDYENFSYVRTSAILLEVANKGYKSADLFEKLGNSFYFKNDMKEAAKWYGELMSLDEAEIKPEYYFRYAQTLKAIENYTESDKWMAKFTEANQSDKRAINFKSSPDYLKAIDLKSEGIQIVNLPFNSANSDFGSTLIDNQFIFASSRGTGRNYAWNNQPFLELYTTSKATDGTFSNLKKFNNRVNTKFHESSVAFHPDGNTIYFTRNNFFKHRLKRDGDGVNRLHLYFAKKAEDGSWKAIKPVHFNKESYSVAHPTINAKGNKLFFASDMPGTLGLSDLFVVDINSDGSLGTPVNLGPSINTEAQETFPFINEKGDLYFSSNGYSGLGGLDIYKIKDFESKLEKGETNYISENVGKPINSPNDDFAYYEDLKASEGYFSSNREGGKGDDDIYWFKFPDCSQKLSGQIFDQQTNQLLIGAKVVLINSEDKIIEEQLVGNDATYNFNNLNCEEQYLVRASKESYATSEIRIATNSNRKEQLIQDVPLTLDKVIIATGTNLRDAFGLNPIYFDLDKSNIRPDAEVELQKIVAILNKYPNMTIDVRSHTDSRNSTSYNDALSKSRNKATIDYIVKIGKIDTSRITGKGYGESELLNKCSDGVTCTEAEHQINRRSDFIIVKM